MSNSGPDGAGTPTVQSVQRAMKLLACFSYERPTLTLNELCEKLGLHKSVVHRLASTLQEAGFLERLDADTRYGIGPAAFETGVLFLRSTDTESRYHRLIGALRDRTGFTVHLAIWDQDAALVIACAESAQMIRVVGGVGTRLPAHATAAGKLLLALQPNEVIEGYIMRGLVRLTPTTIVDAQDLRNHLAEIRAQQYAVNRQENFPGVFGLAVPIPDLNRRKACIAVAAPGPLMPDDVSTLLKTLVRAAQQSSLIAMLEPSND